MAILKVLTYPHKILRTRAQEVTQLINEDHKLIQDMIETMYAQKGVGLAANQVGVLKQIFVASADQIRGKELVFINPRIINKVGIRKEFEGCLSVPEFYEPTKRAKTVWMKALTPSGETVEIKAGGLLARIFQHEIDHLNGILFIDRLGFMKSRFVKSKLSKKQVATPK